MKFRWMKNTDGRPDAVLTMAFVGFLIVAVKFLFSGVEIEFNGTKYSSSAPGADAIAAILTPTLGAYVGRRWTDRKYKEEKKISKSDKDDLRESIS